MVNTKNTKRTRVSIFGKHTTRRVLTITKTITNERYLLNAILRKHQRTM